MVPALAFPDHYISPLSVLESHQHKVTLPACFGATTDQQDIHAAFRRLDPDAQQLVRHTIERLSGDGSAGRSLPHKVSKNFSRHVRLRKHW